MVHKTKEKLICCVYMVHGTPSDRFELMVSMQKLYKNMKVWFGDLDFGYNLVTQ